MTGVQAATAEVRGSSIVNIPKCEPNDRQKN
jgi:hypothetical protein